MHFVNKHLFRLLLLLIIIIISQSVIQVVYQQDNVIHKFVKKAMVSIFTCPDHTIDVCQDRIPSAAKWENVQID